MGMVMKTKLPGYYTIDEAAQVLGKSQDMVRRYVRLRQIPAHVIGQQKLIQQSDVHEFVPPPRGNPNFRNRKSTKRL